MTDFQRLKRVVFWILSQGYAETQEEIAESIDSNASYLSQIVKGKKVLSEKFVNKLCNKYEKVNPIWILKGEGLMLIGGDRNDCEKCIIKDKEINDLKIEIKVLREVLNIPKTEESKKLNLG